MISLIRSFGQIASKFRSLPMCKFPLPSSLINNYYRLQTHRLHKYCVTNRGRYYCSAASSLQPDNFKPKKCKSTLKNIKITEKHFEQLKCRDDKTGRTLMEVVEFLNETDVLLTEYQILVLLNVCSLPETTESSLDSSELTAPSILPYEFERNLYAFKTIWLYLSKNNLLLKNDFLSSVNTDTWNKILVDFQNQLKNYNLKEEDIQIYEGIIYLFCNLQNVSQAEAVLTQMKEKNLPITENIFNALILGYSKNRNIKSCEAVFEAMHAANLVPVPQTYTELAIAYIDNDVAHRAQEILLKHGYTFNQKQLLQILKHAAIKRNDTIIRQMLDILPTESVHNIREIPPNVGNVCNELIRCGNLDEAVSIVNAFPIPNFSENQDTDTFGSSFISNLVKFAENVGKVVEICKHFIDTKRNTRALHIASEVALRSNAERAMEYLVELSRIERLRSHYFWRLFLYESERSNEAGIFKILTEMSKLNVDVDFDTMSYYVLPRLSITLENPIKAIKILQNCGPKTSQILPPIISNLIIQQKYGEIIDIVSLYPTKLDTELFVDPLGSVFHTLRTTRNYNEFAELIHLLCSKSQNSKFDLAGQFLVDLVTSNEKAKNDHQQIKQLLYEFKKLGVKISPSAADIVQSSDTTTKFAQTTESIFGNLQGLLDRKLTINSNLLHGSHIVHPRDMSREGLENHMVELESKQMNTRGTLRRLLQTYIREGNLVKAVEMKKKCDDEGVNLSPGMMASILELYVKLKDIKSAAEIYCTIPKTYPGFCIDEHKVIDLCTLFAENGHLESVEKLLKERADAMQIRGGDYISKNIWQLLQNIANLSAAKSLKDRNIDSNINVTRKYLDYLVDLGYCSYHNNLLGPVIREYILKNNIKAAVREFVDISKKYRKTPLQLELMTYLVALSNNQYTVQFQVGTNEAKDMLETILKLTSEIHGRRNVNTTLLLAVAEVGTEKNLRKLLIDPNFIFNQNSLMKNCEHLLNSGKIILLMRLAKACRGIVRYGGTSKINEQSLYCSLLNNFVKNNDYKSALELFNKLDEEGECRLSHEFTRNLVNLLKANKIDIPSNLELKAMLT